MSVTVWVKHVTCETRNDQRDTLLLIFNNHDTCAGMTPYPLPPLFLVKLLVSPRLAAKPSQNYGEVGIPSNARATTTEKTWQYASSRYKTLANFPGTKLAGNWLKFERKRLKCLPRPPPNVAVLKQVQKNDSDKLSKVLEEDAEPFISLIMTLSAMF